MSVLCYLFVIESKITLFFRIMQEKMHKNAVLCRYFLLFNAK